MTPASLREQSRRLGRSDAQIRYSRSLAVHVEGGKNSMSANVTSIPIKNEANIQRMLGGEGK